MPASPSPAIWTVIACVNGFISVAAGAFAAHFLHRRMSAEGVRIFETAVRYQMYHALALLAVAWMASRGGAGPVDAAPAVNSVAAVNLAGWAFSVGIVLFSGSLYALCLSGVGKLGAITPFGGVAFLVGWVALGVAAFRMSP